MTKILTLIAIVLSSAGLAFAEPAAAGTPYSQGVKDIDIAPAQDHCTAGQALPCTPDAGTGDANVLRILQLTTIETGERHYSTYETTAADDDELWMAASIGAECRTGYHLYSASVRPGYAYDAFKQGPPEEIQPDAPWSGEGFSVPNAKTMPNKLVAVNIPVESAFGPDGFAVEASTLEDLYAYGEDVIDERVADGMNEATARSLPIHRTVHLEMHARVACEGNVFHRIFVKRMPVYLPIEVEYVPVPVPPAKGNARPGQLAVPEGVTDVELAVFVDPDDACTVHLSATITSAIDTEVTYRFIDQWGELSNGFTVDVEADLPEFVSHEVHLDGDGSSGLQLQTPQLQPQAPSDSYVDAPSDLVTGTYQVQVESPNLIHSNIDGFSTDC